MALTFDIQSVKPHVFSEIEAYLQSQGLAIAGRDDSRPWGGFFVLDETQTTRFAEIFFPLLTLSPLQLSRRLSPKMLIVEPHKRLSWQYHFRRREIWRCVAGPVGVVTSPSDQAGPMQILGIGEQIELGSAIRHRLVGLDQWGVVAEIWEHTDERQPSDEEDIVRLEDDYGRSSNSSH